MTGLISTHDMDSVTKLLERGWTPSFSRVTQGERCWVGVGILTSLQLSAVVLEFSLGNERVVIEVTLSKASNNSSEYPAFLESLDGVLDGYCLRTL